MGSEGGIADLLSVAAIAAAAGGCIWLAARARRRRGRLLLLAGSLGFLAFDDAVGLHERVSRKIALAVGISDRADVLFLVPYLPLVVVTFVLLAWIAARSGGAGSSTMGFGLALLGAAIGGRLLASALAALGLTPGRAVVELGRAGLEVAQIGGWALLAAGLWALAWRSHAVPEPDSF